MTRMHAQPSEVTAFALALRMLINERGWTQRRIARAMGISHPQIREYLDGTQEPGFFKVVALADEAGVSLDWLAGRGEHLPRVVVDETRYVPEVMLVAPRGSEQRDPAIASDRVGEVLDAAALARESKRRTRRGSQRG